VLIASIFKELRLLSRDLHGVAVLFIMPILFMLIMSAALSNENELSQDAPIVLLSEPNNPLNEAFFQKLKVEKLNIQQADIAELATYQAALQAGEFELLIANPNPKSTVLSDDKTLELWLNPSVDRGWLLGVKGVLQKHYTQLRLDQYMADNKITLKNNKQKKIKEIEKKVNEVIKLWSNLEDFVLLRRELFDNKFLLRESDGSKYWKNIDRINKS